MPGWLSRDSLLAWVLFRRIFSPLFVLALNGLYFGITSYG